MLLYSKAYWVCQQLLMHSVCKFALFLCSIVPKAAIIISNQANGIKQPTVKNNYSMLHPVIIAVLNFACYFLTPVCISLEGTGERY